MTEEFRVSITKAELEDMENAYVYYFDPIKSERPFKFKLSLPHTDEEDLLQKAYKEISKIGKEIIVPEILVEGLELIDDESLKRFQKAVEIFEKHSYGPFYIQPKELYVYLEPKENLRHYVLGFNKKDALLIDENGFLALTERKYLDGVLFLRV